jgi:hypothetical protein
MSKVTLRPAIAADLAQVIGETLPYRIRAITALVDDRVIGMGGIAFPPHGPAIAFVQLAPLPRRGAAAGDGERTVAGIPEARRYPVAFHRAGLMAMEMIRRSPITQVIATADARSEAAVRWLKRLGFQPAQRQPIAGKVLFVWNRRQSRHMAPPAPGGTEPEHSRRRGDRTHDGREDVGAAPVAAPLTGPRDA